MTNRPHPALVEVDASNGLNPDHAASDPSPFDTLLNRTTKSVHTIPRNQLTSQAFNHYVNSRRLYTRRNLSQGKTRRSPRSPTRRGIPGLASRLNWAGRRENLMQKSTSMEGRGGSASRLLRTILRCPTSQISHWCFTFWTLHCLTNLNCPPSPCRPRFSLYINVLLPARR